MSTQPLVHGFFDPDTATISYVVIDPATKAAALIDSVLDFNQAAGRTNTKSADKLIDCVQAAGATVEWIIETHLHADHLTAAPYLKHRMGGRIAIGAHVAEVQRTFGRIYNAGDDFATDGSQFDHLMRDGEEFKLGRVEARAMHTPGHTPACMSYLIGDALFVGDTLFMPDYGTARCDFPGGDARVLYRSIHKIFALPDATRMYLCHDYLPAGRKEFRWETTVGAQKADNIHVKLDTGEDEFVAMREAKDRHLDMPRLILPAVQVNMRAGHVPAAESNGTSYLKLPLNTF
ncbi:MAG: MBL fold metallo-hydrolase [Proteobacteria bacterium]|nr:MBL fold metallo-hydrolase [Pseudomonadota bacterium]